MIRPVARAKRSGRSSYVALSLAYCAILSWMYINEISVFWAYMGFNGEYNTLKMATSFSLVFLVSAISPVNFDVRSILIATMNFMFIIPSIVFLSYTNGLLYHYISIFILFFFVLGLSSINLSINKIGTISENAVLYIIVGALVLSVTVQAYYGGLSNFNLDIERVYEFRRESAQALPDFFGYLYSNVTGALAPLGILLSQKYKKHHITVLILFLTVILFGITHHKSVLFAPAAVYLFYVALNMGKSVNILVFSISGLVLICLLDVIYIRFAMSEYEASYISSLVVRRLLLVPPMLDGLYIEFFSSNVKYYWSSSKIFSWATSSYYDYSAPFIIGYEYFLDLDTSANTGIVGSGFSNAGLVGVSLYSFILGLIVSLLNNYGKVIGHTFVSSASAIVFFTVLSSTDLVTATLTHGLLLLIIFIAILPHQPNQNSVGKGSA